jgi:hypothetical protein
MNDLTPSALKTQARIAREVASARSRTNAATRIAEAEQRYARCARAARKAMRKADLAAKAYDTLVWFLFLPYMERILPSRVANWLAYDCVDALIDRMSMTGFAARQACEDRDTAERILTHLIWMERA